MKPVPLLIAAAGLALLAACSGPPASAGPAQSPSAVAYSPVAYSHCMRSHGVPAFPDPARTGAFPKASAQQLGVSDARLQAAQGACQHLLPDTASVGQQAQQCLAADACPQPLVQQMLTADRTFARCMRSHGVPGWPDPSLDAEGRPVFDLIPVGITHRQARSQPIAGKLGECQRLDPAQLGLESN
jgi:hypothetical protein